MSKNLTIPFLIWNVILSALLAWSLMRPAPNTQGAGLESSDNDVSVAFVRDTNALKEARVVFFRVDSIRDGSEYFAEARKQYEAEEKRLRQQAQSKARNMESQALQLMEKDQTYLTNAEREADQMRLMKIDSDMRQLGADLEDELMNYNRKVMIEFSSQLQDALKEYNATAGYDFIISLEPGGQVWPGNEGLDITPEVMARMNKIHRSRKADAKK
ncbi:MAG: OmpH family outer membrane protein [Flavobacteriales bacterium]|nr:OmpH family outer membrane protein [Flavobacteriales bacterium]